MEIRLFKSTDSIEAINALLREAYASLAESGLNFSAASEDVEATRRNINSGECYLGFLNERLVSTVVLRTHLKDSKTVSPIDWYNHPEVANFGRLAVIPSQSGKGLASQMMDAIEARATELNYRELALDTSEQASHLLKIYSRRGYRFVAHHQWPDKVYRSVVFSKTL